MDTATITVYNYAVGEGKLVYMNSNNELTTLLIGDSHTEEVSITAIKNSVITLYGNNNITCDPTNSNYTRYYTQAEDGDNGVYTMIAPLQNSFSLLVEDK